MKTWNEKNTFEKVMDIISGIAVIAWIILGIFERNGTINWKIEPSFITATIICICQAFSSWNDKRVISYIAIGGIVCMIATIILMIL